MAYQGTKLEIKLPPTDNFEALSRTTVLYGDSTAGKTSHLYEAALYLLAKSPTKKIRLISAEDSTRKIFSPLLKTGQVQGMFISRIKDPIPLMRSLAGGAWTNTDDACAYFIEGLSTIAEIIQEDNRENKRFLGEQSVNSYKLGESSEVFSLPGQFSYNAVQMEMARYLREFAMIPNIEHIIWTAHEAKGSIGVSSITGPGLVGKAGTATVIKYCGTLLHLDVTSNTAGKTSYKLYLKNHPDPVTPAIQSLAKITLPLHHRGPFLSALGLKSVDEALEVTVGSGGHLKNSLADVLKAEDSLTN